MMSPLNNSLDQTVVHEHSDLMVVQTKAILLLKSMSERGGSDIEPL